MSGPTYEIRTYRGPEDDPIIYHSWCSQIRRARPFTMFEADTFRGYKRDVLEPIVARANVALASNPQDPGHVYGWACGEHVLGCDVLHMVYVRELARNGGLGTALMRQVLPDRRGSPILFTHQTQMSKRVERSWGLVYAPQFTRLWLPVTKEQVCRAHQ